MKKGTKIFLIITAAFLGLIILVGAGAYSIFGEKLAAIDSIRVLREDEPLYYIEYKGDYGLDGLLEQGVESDEDVADYLIDFLSGGFYSAEPAEAAFYCSTIAAVDENGNYVCGRNFDWVECAAMIVRTEPKDGYKSVSTCNLDFITGGERLVPGADFMSSMTSLAAVFVPLDGMNEKGLCVADLIIRGLDGTEQNSGKTDVTTTVAIRLLLDRAATVDEAIALLEDCDMHSSAGMTHHLSISDASGRSVVVEYIDNEMYVTETQFVTNHVLAPGEHFGMGESTTTLQRFDTLSAIYEDANGVLNTDEIRSALQTVADDTMWSIVYNKTELSLEFFWDEDYESGYSFAIDADGK